MRVTEHAFITIVLMVVTFIGCLVMAAMDTEGTPVQSTYNETDFSYPRSSSRETATHTKDDYLVVAHCPGGDAISIAYKETGGPWEYQIIHDTGNANTYRSGGVINTLNNSVLVYASYVTATYYELHLFIKYPANGWDVWTNVAISTIAGGRWAVDMALNDTGQICLMASYTTSAYWLRYFIYDFPNLTKTVGGAGGSSLPGSPATTSYSTGQVIANMTGRFHFFWAYSPYLRWRDLDDTIPQTNIAGTDADMVVCLPNDRFVCAGHYSTTGKPIFRYQATHMATSWTYRYVEAASRVYESAAMGISVRQNSTFVTLISYCNDDERLTKWGAQFDATELTWRNSQSDTGVTDTDDIACFGNFGALWPVHPSTGIRWTRPKGGWAVLARDENGTDDEMDLLSEGATWTVDLTTDDPNITTTSLPDATYGEFWSYTLEKEGGTNPFIWSILIKPSWMSIGATNGTLYGTPDATGFETVRVKLADAVPRYDEVEWTLTIKTASAGGNGDNGDGEGTSFVIDEMGEMWVLLAGTAVFVGVARAYKMAIWRRNTR